MMIMPCHKCGTPMTLRNDGSYICPKCGHTQSSGSMINYDNNITAETTTQVPKWEVKS